MDFVPKRHRYQIRLTTLMAVAFATSVMLGLNILHWRTLKILEPGIGAGATILVNASGWPWPAAIDSLTAEEEFTAYWASQEQPWEGVEPRQWYDDEADMNILRNICSCAIIGMLSGGIAEFFARRTQITVVKPSAERS